MWSWPPVTQIWLATSDDPVAIVTGRYFYHQHPRETQPAASSLEVQEGLLAASRKLTGVDFSRTRALDVC